MNRLFQYSLLFIIGMLALSSCRKDKISTNASDKLSFSVDTLRFDTVFTERGSATREFKVYNNSKQPIVISKIMMGGGAASPYKINVDGNSGTIISDVRVEAEDSIYVFTEVTIEAPNSIDSPFIVMDSVVFETNGNIQDVNIESFGQNANYVGESGKILFYDCSTHPLGAIWNDPKPYVILGFMIVDDCDLYMQAGTRVHFQGGVVVDDATMTQIGSGNLLIGSDALLKVLGTVNDPVVFRTDRIEPEFEDIPGQWGGIILSAGSTGNEMNFLEIRNSSVGFYVDSAATLTLKNSTIHETSGSGILSLHGNITAVNSIIYDCGQYNLQLEYGGNHNFYNCTFVNVGANRFISHQEPVLRISNYFVSENPTTGVRTLHENDANVLFENCLIYGNRTDEIVLDDPDVVMANINATFDHCLIKADTLDMSMGFIEPIINEDPLFVDPSELDYRLDTIISPAYNAGRMPTFSLGTDLDGNTRIVGDTIDIGAYEFFE